jgi:alkyl sulfatase BDS1-like metallo-beta-lactamase superfamily hydrolase
MRAKILTQIVAAVSITVALCTTALAQSQHFHPKGKPPSEHTKKIFEEARPQLPFSDKQDFEEIQKGFIARPESGIIMADAGHEAWNKERYEFLLTDDEIDSIHPSMLRSERLNMNFGLYEVIPWYVPGARFRSG